MIYRKLANTHFYLFDSISDHTESVHIPGRKVNGHEDYYFISAQSKFIGRQFSGWDDVLTKINIEWPEGLAILDRMKRQIQDEQLEPPKSLKRRAAWDEDDGSEVDIDRLQKGQPYWRTTRRVHRPGPIAISVIANLGALQSVSAENILWRGASMIVLTELLEQAGYRVELWGARYGIEAYQNGDNNAYAIQLKGSMDLLNPSSLINAVSGWAYRTVGFGTNYLSTLRVHETFGASKPLPEFVCNEITLDSQRIVCDDVWSFDGAIRFLKQQLEKIK